MLYFVNLFFVYSRLLGFGVVQYQAIYSTLKFCSNFIDLFEKSRCRSIVKLRAFAIKDHYRQPIDEAGEGVFIFA